MNIDLAGEIGDGGWEAERRAAASRGRPCNGISSRDSDGIVRKSNTTCRGGRLLCKSEPGDPTFDLDPL
jgi:hypothetical protein